MSDSREFVARQAELETLDALLDQALEGDGRICFVSGDAGAGKTTLLTEFAQRAQERIADLVVATGNCDAQVGVGDPYLPFREILQLLSGDVETRLAQGRITEENAGRVQNVFILVGEALVDVAPDLIGMFVPGASLIGKAGRFLAGRTGWADRLRKRLAQQEDNVTETLDKAQVYEQYVNVLQRLSSKAPLLLVLDDLQWADAASLGLLFRLARRLEGCRILVLGTYRPSDVSLGRSGERHPLEPMVSELKRYLGDITIDLDARREEHGREFVDAYLGREANQFDERFHAALYEHTGGHPLFTVELLRHLQESGSIVRDGGAWVVTDKLEWMALPSRVEGIIEERLGRLDHDLQRSLTIASVEGPQFTAEVVAKVLPMEARELVRSLSDTLQKQHRLVSAQGLERVGEQRVSHYAFAHQLMQSYLYGQLDEVEASYLHEDVGRTLEELYGDRAGTIAVQLARHYDLAGLPDKAQPYLVAAGRAAAARYANDEAVAHFSRALSVMSHDASEERFELMLDRAKVYDLMAERDAQRADLEALALVASALGDPKRQGAVALQRASYDFEVGEYAAACASAEAAIAAAVEVQDTSTEAEGRALWGRALLAQSKYVEAKEQLNIALGLALEADLGSVEAACMRNLGIAADLMGERRASRDYFERSLAAQRRLGHRTGEGRALANLGVSAWRMGDHKAARDYFEQALMIHRMVGDRANEGKSLANLAMVMTSLDAFEDARKLADQALAINREIASPYSVARTLGIRASASIAVGEFVEAQASNEEALAIDVAVQDRQDEGYRLYWLGYVAAALGLHDVARSKFDQCLKLAQALGDKTVQASCLLGLARLHHVLGNAADARDCAEASVLLSVNLGDEEPEALAQIVLGHARLALGDTESAAAAIERAQELDPDGSRHEVAAAYATIALKRGDIAAAVARVEPIVEELMSTRLDGVGDRFEVYLTTYLVLVRAADPRADAVLARAQTTLRDLAERISDPDIRRAFVEDIPSHWQIMSTVGGS